jgi:hypothetical protein
MTNVWRCDGCDTDSSERTTVREVSLAGVVDAEHLCMDCLEKVEEKLDV